MKHFQSLIERLLYYLILVILIMNVGILVIVYSVSQKIETQGKENREYIRCIAILFSTGVPGSEEQIDACAKREAAQNK